MFRRVQLKGFERGSFYMVLSALMGTFMAFFVEAAMVTVYLPLMVFLRFFVPFLFTIPYFCYYYNQIREISFRRTARHVLRALAIVASQYALFYYFTEGSLTNGVLLINTAPLFIPIVSYVYLRYKASRVVWVSLIVSFVGVICVLKPSSSVFDYFSIFGFIAGFFVAVSQVLYGVNRERDTLPQNIFLFFLYTSILSLIAFLLTLIYSPFKEVVGSSFLSQGLFWPVLSIICIGFGSVINQYVRGKSYQYAKPASVAPFIYLSVVFAAVLDQILHPGSIHGFNFFTGMILIFLGTTIRLLYSAKA